MQPVILLTGATGFVGGATAVELLQYPDDVELLCLVRANSALEAQQRLRRSLIRFTDERVLESILPRARVLVADLTKPGGWDSGELRPVTHVLHLAANTSLNSKRGVIRVNVLGTLALIKRLHQANDLRRFLYVSTAHVCGRQASSFVQEDDYPRWGTQHVVPYTRSKAVCELLFDRMAPGLPVIVARPSIVVGHTRLGCRPSASIFWYYQLVDRLGLISTTSQSRKDIVPVDYVAHCLARLLLKDELRFRRYHISAGPDSSVTWRQMQLAFARAAGRRAGAPYRRIDPEEIVAHGESMCRVAGCGDENRVLRAVQPFYRLSASGVQVFDNSRLLSEGFSAPPKFTSYLKRCLATSDGRDLFQQSLDDE
jgi:nucleoside-diphosphate-sugar epimerase